VTPEYLGCGTIACVCKEGCVERGVRGETAWTFVPLPLSTTPQIYAGGVQCRPVRRILVASCNST
jgi:hypothetical protein